MFCNHCGKPNPDEAAYCWGCGAELIQSHPDVGESGPTVIEDPPAPGGSYTSGTLVDGRYRIERLIGQGGMGRVWGARDLKLNVPVALKFISPALWENPAARERFLGEARLCLGLTHPGIVRLHTIGEWLGQAYLVLEYLEGQTLAERLAELKRAGQRLAWPEAAAILDRLAEAVEVAHRASVIHRDLKPANIMLVRREDGGQRLVVLDFGLAKAIGAEGPTLLGASLGTPFYMAPEQIRDGSRADARADIYAIGAIAYELLTGRVPLGRLAAIRESCPAVPAPIEAWIFGALEPEPEARKAGLAELRQLLRKTMPGLDEPPKKEEEKKEKQKETTPAAEEKADGGAGKPVDPKARPQGDPKTQPKTADQGGTAGAGSATGSTVKPKPIATGTGGGSGFWKAVGYLLLVSLMVYGQCQRAQKEMRDKMAPLKKFPTMAPIKWPTYPGGKNLFDGKTGVLSPKSGELSPELKKMLNESPRPSTSRLFENERKPFSEWKLEPGIGAARDGRKSPLRFEKAAQGRADSQDKARRPPTTNH